MIRYLTDRWLPPMVRARQRYLKALREQQPFAALRSTGVPEIHVIHTACGMRHLSWEYCPEQSPRTLRVGRMEVTMPKAGPEETRVSSPTTSSDLASATAVERSTAPQGELTGKGRV